jgi:hypothetical protein
MTCTRNSAATEFIDCGVARQSSGDKVRKLYLATLATSLILLILSGSIAAETPRPLTITIGEQAIEVRGVTPGQKLTVLIVSRDESGRWPTVHRTVTEVEDSDRDGTASVPLVQPLPLTAVAAVVNHADGRYALATPGSNLSPAAAALETADGATRRFVAQVGRGEALLVRPGMGAWSLSFSEGGAVDVDGRHDHRATIAFDRMRGKGGVPAPDRLLPHDTLIVVDTSSLAVFAHQEAGR